MVVGEGGEDDNEGAQEKSRGMSMQRRAERALAEHAPCVHRACVAL